MQNMHSEITPHQIAALRRFNRLYTREIGTLREGLLDSEYSLTEARVLYELATREAPTAGEIAKELDLDAGYLSRILRKFELAGLLKRSTSSDDARQAFLVLTRRGKNAFADLDERSASEARRILEGVPTSRLTNLLEAMQTIEEALEPGIQRAPFILRHHRPGDMGWVVQRHGALYAQEYGWDERFEALVARITADFIDRYDGRRDRCWIAERDGVPLGCIFLVHHPELADVAKLRLLLVEPGARGLGLGKALVEECTRFARTAGYKKITLWTNNVLTGARRIYERAGYTLVKEEPHHSFGHDLVGQTWELPL
jgi:DNA-binding MarR family transcriptional regulator/GNAT superfamily N-acetyltransferase